MSKYPDHFLVKKPKICENRAILVLERYKIGMIKMYETMTHTKSTAKEANIILKEILEMERNINVLKKNLSYENI